MNSVDFIKKAVVQLLDAFPCSKLRYEYNEDCDIHLLKVSSDSIIKTEEYAKISDSIIDQFLDEFPMESISFLSEDSVLSIDNPTETFYGKDYFIDVHVESATSTSSYIQSYLSKITLSSSEIKGMATTRAEKQPSKDSAESNYAMAA